MGCTACSCIASRFHSTGQSWDAVSGTDGCVCVGSPSLRMHRCWVIFHRSMSYVLIQKLTPHFVPCRCQCSPLWCTTLRSVTASRLHMEGWEFSQKLSNTIGIPCMEQYWWAKGRGVPAIWFSLNKVWMHSANFTGGLGPNAE